MYNFLYKKGDIMNILDRVSSKIHSGFQTVGDHFQKHGKTYLIGIAIVTASSAAMYIRANLDDPDMIRIGGGRKIAFEEFVTEAGNELVNATSILWRERHPILAKLAELMGARHQRVANPLFQPG